MKLRYFVLTFIIMLLSAVAISAAEAPLRVGLLYDTTARDRVVVRSLAGFQTDLAEDLGYEMIATVSEGNIVLYNGTGEFVIYTGKDGADVRAVVRDSIFEVDGKSYRGDVVFRPQNGKVNLINEIYVDHYLYGVVPAEMSYSWPSEALKAQAVAARCYALRSIGRHSDFGFDICATTHCQVYGGLDLENARSNDAVAATAGIVATYDGKIIEALYCASNGGYTEVSENVWSGKYPYFSSAVDEYEKTDEIKDGVWTKTFTAEEIKNTLLKSGVDIGDILDLRVVKTSASGRVVEVEVVGTTGTKTYTKNSAKSFLGLRSQLYTITTPANDIYGLSQQGLSVMSGTYYILTAEGIDTRSASASNGKFVINGRGYGHGVGMSQWGAYYMAAEGFTYQDILAYYYKGSVLKNYSDIK